MFYYILYYVVIRTAMRETWTNAYRYNINYLPIYISQIINTLILLNQS